MRIAVAQTPGVMLAQWRETLKLIEDLIARAAGKRADLVVLPECVWPAYFLGSAEQYFEARRDGLPGESEFLKGLESSARKRRIAICAGYVAERESPGPNGHRLLNASCIIDKTGRIVGRYAKCFLWDFDRRWFEPGDRIEPMNLDDVCIGSMVCADARIPEIPATLVARGASLIVQPTAWVEVGPPGCLRNPQPEFLIPERAREFGVPIASASKWGVEGETTFVGTSLICAADGDVLACCGQRETEIAVAEVELARPKKPKLSSAERAALTCAATPVRVRADVNPLAVFLVPSAQVPTNPGWRQNVGVAERSAGAALVLRPLATPSHAGAVSPSDEDALSLSGPASEVHSLQGIRIAAVRDEDAARFPPLRALALRGIHLAVVFGERVDERALRTRATENRIFVIHVSGSGASVFAPTGERETPGRVVSETVDARGVGPADFVLPVATAADKCVAWSTDVIAGRTPALYEF